MMSKKFLEMKAAWAKQLAEQQELVEGPGLRVEQSRCGHVAGFNFKLGTIGLASCIPVGVLCQNGMALAHFDTEFSPAQSKQMMEDMLKRVPAMLGQLIGLGAVLVVNIGNYKLKEASALSDAIDYAVRSQICLPYLPNAKIITTPSGLAGCDAVFWPDNSLHMAEGLSGVIRDWKEADNFVI